MAAVEALPEIKRVGANGQVSVGKASAGKLVRIEPTADGILLRFVRDVPEKQQDQWWLHEPYKTDLKKALEWAATHPAQATDIDAFEAMVKAHHAKRSPKTPLTRTPKSPKKPTKQAASKK